LTGVDSAFLSLLGAMFGEDFLQDFRRNRPAAFIDLMIAFESRNGSSPYLHRPQLFFKLLPS
jgi:hypothetical protein